MTKANVVKIWIGGLIAMGGGLLIAGINIGLMFAFGGSWSTAASGNGYDFVPAMNGIFGTTVAFIVLGGVVVLVGGIVQLAAWVGALMNTNRLLDKTWFAVLLIGGLLGVIFAPIGFAAMLAYVVAGPDGMASNQPPVAPVNQPPATPVTPSTTLAPTT